MHPVLKSNAIKKQAVWVSKARWQSGHAADCKSVNLGSTPGRASIATLAQLVERNLAKVEVTSSNLVCRSSFKADIVLNDEQYGRGVEQPGSSSGS